jgi:hypothetical protein
MRLCERVNYMRTPYCVRTIQEERYADDTSDGREQSGEPTIREMRI